MRPLNRIQIKLKIILMTSTAYLLICGNLDFIFTIADLENMMLSSGWFSSVGVSLNAPPETVSQNGACKERLSSERRPLLSDETGVSLSWNCWRGMNQNGFFSDQVQVLTFGYLSIKYWYKYLNINFITVLTRSAHTLYCRSSTVAVQ